MVIEQMGWLKSTNPEHCCDVRRAGSTPQRKHIFNIRAARNIMNEA